MKQDCNTKLNCSIKQSRKSVATRSRNKSVYEISSKDPDNLISKRNDARKLAESKWLAG